MEKYRSLATIVTFEILPRQALKHRPIHHLLIPRWPMIRIPPQTRLFQPGLPAFPPRKGP
jgi:hypothetical protein